MENIIYKSNNIIPWDTQSAFKMTSYNGCVEEHLIFCYLKGYVYKKDLKICTYTFVETPEGDDNLTLTLVFNGRILKIVYGYDGISKITQDGVEISVDSVGMNVFRANDEQGFYWCGEITVSEKMLREKYGFTMSEGCTFGLNLVQNFSDSDIGAVYGDCESDDFDAVACAGQFTVLEY